MADGMPKTMIVAEFLDFDDGRDRRCELADDVPVAMNPPSEWHTAISGAIADALFGRPKAPGRPYLGGRVGRAGEGRTWRIAATLLSPEPPLPAFSKLPRLIFEILSPSTEKDDRTSRLDCQRTFPSLQAILLVAQ